MASAAYAPPIKVEKTAMARIDFFIEITPKIYNLGTGVGYSVLDVVKNFEEAITWVLRETLAFLLEKTK